MSLLTGPIGQHDKILRSPDKIKSKINLYIDILPKFIFSIDTLFIIKKGSENYLVVMGKINLINITDSLNKFIFISINKKPIIYTFNIKDKKGL